MNSHDPTPLTTLAQIEKLHIEIHLVQSGYRVKVAAKTLGVTGKTLYNKIHDYGWSLEEMRTQHRLYKTERHKQKLARLSSGVS